MSRISVRSVMTMAGQRPRECQSLVAHEELLGDLRGEPYRATSLRSCDGVETVTMRSPKHGVTQQRLREEHKHRRDLR